MSPSTPTPRGKRSPYRGVIRINKRLSTGEVRTYCYHRPTKTRLYSPYGSAAFRAEWERAERGTLAPPVRAGRDGKPKSVWVYFIQANASGLIKIGKAGNVAHRIRELKTGCPDELILLGKTLDLSGGVLETNLHASFARFRVRGEWFRPEAPILAFIEKHAPLGPGRRAPTSVEAPFGPSPTDQQLSDLGRSQGVPAARQARAALAYIAECFIKASPVA